MIRKALLAALAAVALTPAATHARPGGIEHAQLIDTITLRAPLFHVQGVDLDSQHIWVTSVDSKHQRGYLQEFDRATGAFMRRLDLTDGARFHPGGISIANHAIWVPVAEYRSNSSAVLEQIDPDSLTVRRKIRVADHLGCVAASDTRLVAGNWDSKRLYLIDLNSVAPMRVVPNPSATRYQDMKFIDGQLVAGGYLNRHRGTIDWIDYPTMTVQRSLQTGTAPHGKLAIITKAYSGEGMTVQGQDLYVLPNDHPGKLYHFRLDDTIEPVRNQVAILR